MKRRSLVLFTKAPIPGYVKTRLSPPLTSAECAELQEAFIRDAVSKFRHVDAVLKICFSPRHAGSFFEEFNVETFPQDLGDLGERMFRCLQGELLQGFQEVLLLGADVPLLTARDVSEGYGLLKAADILFGPATDGGYYCIGTKGVLPQEVFSGIQWSSPHVLETSQARAREAGLITARMKIFQDVDTLQDLRTLYDVSPGGATGAVLDKLAENVLF